MQPTSPPNPGLMSSSPSFPRFAEQRDALCSASLTSVLLLLVFSGAPLAFAERPPIESEMDARELTAVIDRELAEAWRERKVEPADRCTDPEFIRRLSLDLLGRIPTRDESRSFLKDARPGKREHLVKHLLASEDHVQHFADLYDALLMGRGSRSDYAERRKHHWRGHVERLFRDNRPWDQFVTETLLARPKRPEDDGQVWFLYERKNDHQKLAEAIAPAFFGFRIECAQCHDHPLAMEIEQRHYWGLVAFFNRSKNVNTKHGPRVAESAVGGFSEFADLSGASEPNLLTFFDAPTVDEPRPTGDQQDSDALYFSGKKGEPRVPKFSRREQFVREVAANHPLLARAAVNRVWSLLMGRGIVHPVDEMDSEHPPSHPELLDALATFFTADGLRFRRLIQAIVLSNAYQLQSNRPTGVEDPASFAWCLERPLTAEQWSRSIQLALRGGFQNDASLTADFREQFPAVGTQQNTSTVKKAMFLSNNSALRDYIAASNGEGMLMPRVMEAKSEPAVEELFQTLFTRGATTEESDRIQKYVAAREGREAEAWQQVAWALLTSAEFRFNH